VKSSVEHTVFGIENIVLILYFSQDPTLLCVCVKTESQWEMLTGAPGALVKEVKVEAFALKIV
jgi:hypothetical protein